MSSLASSTGSSLSTFNRATHSNKTLPSPKFTKLSFAERKAVMSRPSTSHIVEGDRLLRDIDRGAPGDPAMDKSRRKSLSRPDVSKRRSTFFEDAFSYKENNPIKERVRSESTVLAEIKTNVIVSDEFTFLTELSYHLSTRYQRPVSSVVVSLQHGACMLYAGTFEPAYVMAISALPSQLLPATNKRNAALVQKHMEEAIGVKPERGLLRFIPTGEENVATNGKTMAGEIDDLEKSSRGLLDDSVSITSRKSKARRRLSIRSFTTLKSPSAVNIPAPELTPPTSAVDESPPEMPAVEPTPKARRRKSFVATIFGRSSGKNESRPPVPELPRQ
ncbi:Tautomerase/MIF [Thozetella sp. PMI_491]|nr:Tautomerase/MIF [Thozetella sp. PMI_491]